MTFLLLQTFVLLLASYFLGALVACLVKRSVLGSGEAEPVAAIVESPVPPPIVAPPPVRIRSPRVAQPATPRPIDPVQPRIEVLRRPEPRPAPKVMDPSRFERALMGPDPNEGIPRKAIVELRPAVIKSPTGPARPWPPPPTAPPTPVPEPAKPASEASKLVATASKADATTSAAAGAVAAAKAAAAASVGGANIHSERHSSAAVLSSTPPPAPAEAKSAAPPPVKAQLEPEPPKPAPKAPPVITPPIEGGDDLQRIRAIDADMEQLLKADGIIYFEHIAAWTPGDVKRFSQWLGIPGRVDREQWVEQAQILAKGGETYYSRNRLASQKADATGAKSVPGPALSTDAKSGSDTASMASAQVPAASEKAPPAESAAIASPSSGGVAAVIQNRSVAEMAAAAAAAIAAASASVTRGLKPIEPISPLSKVDPKISIPAKLSDAIKEKSAATAAAQVSSEAKEESLQPQTDGPSDDLKRIRGIGVLIEKRLNAIGVARYEQIAHWTSGDIDRVSQTLEFKGRIERESWVEQARILSSGGQTEFSRRVDRGEVDTSRDA